MNDLEKAARQYHEAYRAHTKAVVAQSNAHKRVAENPSPANTGTWLDAVAQQRRTLRDEETAMNNLALAALLVPELM